MWSRITIDLHWYWEMLEGVRKPRDSGTSASISSGVSHSEGREVIYEMEDIGVTMGGLREWPEKIHAPKGVWSEGENWTNRLSGYSSVVPDTIQTTCKISFDVGCLVGPVVPLVQVGQGRVFSPMA